LAFQHGDNTIQATKGGALSSMLTFGAAAPTRTAGSTANFVYTDGTIGGDNSIVLTGQAAGFINQGMFVNGANYAYMNAVGTYVRAAVYGSDAGFVDATSLLVTGSHNRVTSSIAGQTTGTANTIKFDGAGAVDLTLASNGLLTVSNGGLLRAGGGSTTISSGSVRAGGNVELVVRTDSASDTMTISSNIVGNGVNGNPLTKSGAGTLTLSGSNSYAGGTYVDGGMLSVSSNVNLGSAGSGIILNNGTLQATSSFSLSNGVTDRSITLINAGVVDVTASNVFTVTGTISDGYTPASTNNFRKGSLNKTGTGVLVLSTTNTYNGDTTVSAGTLILSGALTNTRSITVASSGTLTVNGATNASAAVTVAGVLNGVGTVGGATTVTGQLNPGNSPGLLTFSSALTLSGNSANTTMEIIGTSRGLVGGYDAIDIGASQLLTYDGTLTLTMTSVIADGNYELFNFSSGFDAGGFDSIVFAGGAYSGPWTQSGPGTGIWNATSGGQSFTFTESTGDLLVAAVPEPSSALLFGAAGTVLLVFRRRSIRR
jgi:autotransporter-associated beta strand protein